MKLGFFGAAKTVTGSNHLLETTGGKLIIDCGMFQGGKDLRDRNTEDFSYNPSEINAVIITHGHIDHIGLLPKLVKHGFRGSIYATVSTHELMEVLLNDTARIQESDIQWENKKRSRRGEEPLEPIYDQEDVNKTLSMVKDIGYHKEFVPIDNVKAVFRDAGHILGSSFLELKITENNIVKTVIFSGDIGRSNQEIIKDPETADYADMVIIESTYGDRLHKTSEDTDKEIADILKAVSSSAGTLLIPAFALGRTQEMIYKFFELFDKHEIPEMPVYVDSPMATKVTEIYEKNRDLYDDEIMGYLNKGKNPFIYKELIFCETKDESMKLNNTPGPKVIISSSGMCDAGRILHHLKHNIWQKNTHVLFVGFQGKDTLGRQLIEGAKKVRILGEMVQVNAQIHTIGGLSAHADRDELVEWLKQFSGHKPKVFIVHGEPEVELFFSDTVKKELGFETMIPGWKEVLDIPFTTEKAEIKTISKKEIVPEKKYDEYVRWKDVIYKVENKLLQIEKTGDPDKEELKENLLKKINLSIEELIK
jgi:metallo-beta-lactamase family protein